MEHPLNVALISLAIASTELCGVNIKNDRSILVEICKTGMLHNFGGVSKIEKILKVSPERWFSLYWKANLEGLEELENFQLGYTITDAIRYICEYNTDGNYDFVSQIDRSSVIANIVQTAEIFLQKESGLFVEPQPVKRVVNYLNIRVAEKKINLNTVLALTFGLNLVDLFDYYKELENLASDCLFGDSGVPYPLAGLNSATLFVCKDSVAKCKYLSVTRKAVNLAKQMGRLKPGKYFRCLLLTYKLQEFYKKHYKEIKETIISSKQYSD